MFRITDKKGFHMTFDNGITVSVQFGEGNYCSNRIEVHKDQGDIICSNAEVAVWNNKNEDIISKFTRNEKGWVSADRVAEIIIWAKNYV